MDHYAIQRVNDYEPPVAPAAVDEGTSKPPAIVSNVSTVPAVMTPSAYYQYWGQWGAASAARQTIEQTVLRQPQSSTSQALPTFEDESTLMKRKYQSPPGVEAGEGDAKKQKHDLGDTIRTVSISQVENLAVDARTDAPSPQGPSYNNEPPKWRKVSAENLDVDVCTLLSGDQTRALFAQCERELVYNTGALAQLHIFGKWLDIPRKQVAFGDDGLSYRFSGNTVPARPWLPFLRSLRDHISKLTGHPFNFVLVNRYKDGSDYIGEHKDDEKDLDHTRPIASLSLGQTRPFYFKHQDSRGAKASRNIPKVEMELTDGCLLLMNSPTNRHWYHCLPKRSPNTIQHARISFTFRCMLAK